MTSNPIGGNFIFLRHLDANFVQKWQKCQICVIYENLDCRLVHAHPLHVTAVADLRGVQGVQILSISCSFWEISAKSFVGTPTGELAPLLREILDPPLDRVSFSWYLIPGLCTPRLPVPNGSPDYDKKPINNWYPIVTKSTFSCIPGYTLSGSSGGTCTHLTTWSGGSTQCNCMYIYYRPQMKSGAR